MIDICPFIELPLDKILNFETNLSENLIVINPWI